MAAKRRGTTGDRALMSSTLVISSMPYYIVALMVALYLTILYPILPRGGWTPFRSNPAKWFVGLLTPWLVLGDLQLHAVRAVLARLDGGDAERGLHPDRPGQGPVGPAWSPTSTRCAPGLIPVITIFGLDVAGSLAGAIFTERIFDLPGLGNLVLESLNNYDLPVIMGTVLVASVILVAMNFLVVDIVYSMIDPRVRLRDHTRH